ncbi:exodeoxyribonuclease VII large subunit [Butyrivibrio sp. INlla16]|uniref:exodeoxyribonuclease VII large subunit n=1 Tax=Butyrivibrio sp. INlla16 TaxID=1520807 RepID=UPI00088DB46C|nr:exodeoxyribonuclease VII large subunit [Butyrivibrio sp. INlla16]SDB43610.1 Exodeoxyribonuclease VII large subunit [Butyrivibrio sp. INlla16]
MRNVYTVEQINSYIKNMFTQDFLLSSLTVKGEVSNCKYHSSGHIYFTLKDASGAISCVMFRGSAATGLRFRMKEGQQVCVTGSIDVYERDGKYQLYARKIELDGAGALFERFEALKKELSERGMFANEYKQPIPKHIKTLGVVTAPTGAAVRDIINISTRRNPYVQIYLYPAIVQGDQAKESIVRGIETLTAMNVDVIIVGRGGGSIEDLWAFNEEVVAEAIFNCPIPIISAVGHETDTTIADYVADLRAPTPSAAAELAVYEIDLLFQDIDAYRDILTRMMNDRIMRLREKAASDRRLLEHLSPEARIRDQRMRAAQAADRLERLMTDRIRDNRHRLDVDIERLKALSPLDKLQSGFSYVADSEGKNVRSIKNVSPGDKIEINVSDGVIGAEVIGAEKRKYG